MRKSKTRTSWVWEMRNDHYGVRKKAKKHGKWGMKQDLAAWKFRTQNLVVTCTLILRINLEYFPKFILDRLYTVSKIGKWGVQCFKWCINQSWNEEVMSNWRQLCKAKGPIEMISKFNLWIRNPIQNDPNFEFTHYHFDVLPPLPWELHLGHSIHSKWALQD